MAGACIFFALLFFSMLLAIKSAEASCIRVKCSDNEPEIHFPFHLQSYQPSNCGLSGYELFCQENTTKIHIPSYGNLVVKSISYDLKRLNLLDPRNCIHEVFLNLNLSLTPFEYYYVVKNYTYLNCSMRLPSSFIEVPCLSGSRHHVYTVESSLFPVPKNCWSVKSVAIPFAYSPYLADNSFGLGFIWKLPDAEDCEAKTRCTNYTEQISKGFSSKFLFVGHEQKITKVVLCMVVVITVIAIYIWKHRVKIPKQNMENQKLLGA